MIKETSAHQRKRRLRSNLRNGIASLWFKPQAMAAICVILSVMMASLARPKPSLAAGVAS